MRTPRTPQDRSGRPEDPRADPSLQGVEKNLLDAAEYLLLGIGEDPRREGLRETPHRFARAALEWFGGYREDPAAILRCFEDGAERVDEMIVQVGIPVWSHCEHHLAPFFGTAAIGYIAKGKIVGLSKLARLTRIFSRRLQVQERLTQQIAKALTDHVSEDVGVIVTCRHTCMESRGVSIMGTETTTSSMSGVFRRKPEVRAEFLALVGKR